MAAVVSTAITVMNSNALGCETGLHGVTTQKIQLIIVTGVKAPRLAPLNSRVPLKAGGVAI
jgi:hypothetical protein